MIGKSAVVCPLRRPSLRLSSLTPTPAFHPSVALSLSSEAAPAGSAKFHRPAGWGLLRLADDCFTISILKPSIRWIAPELDRPHPARAATANPVNVAITV